MAFDASVGDSKGMALIVFVRYYFHKNIINSRCLIVDHPYGSQSTPRMKVFCRSRLLFQKRSLPGKILQVLSTGHHHPRRIKWDVNFFNLFYDFSPTMCLQFKVRCISVPRLHHAGIIIFPGHGGNPMPWAKARRPETENVIFVRYHSVSGRFEPTKERGHQMDDKDPGGCCETQPPSRRPNFPTNWLITCRTATAARMADESAFPADRFLNRL